MCMYWLVIKLPKAYAGLKVRLFVSLNLMETVVRNLFAKLDPCGTFTIITFEKLCTIMLCGDWQFIEEKKNKQL